MVTKDLSSGPIASLSQSYIVNLHFSHGSQHSLTKISPHIRMHGDLICPDDVSYRVLKKSEKSSCVVEDILLRSTT